jgi:uncharacterized membrane protein
MMSARQAAVRGVVQALGLATLLCAAFYIWRIVDIGKVSFSYLPWNLFLAWIPLGLMALLVRSLRTRSWSSWPMLLLSLVWLLFLPNSFYLVSDYIHLQDIVYGNILYDAILFTMFVFTGLLLGFSSVYMFHVELLKRLSPRRSAVSVGLVFLACSVAIYIGRDLRWNSWDVFSSPAGLLFDVSDRLVRTSNYHDVVGTVAAFFALLGGMYVVGWRLAHVTRA